MMYRTKMELKLTLLTFVILFLKTFRIIKTKRGFNSDSNKLQNGLGWLFELNNSYLSRTILNFAVPFYSVTECNDQMIERVLTAMMLLRYFRRRSSVVPYRNIDVNYRRCRSPRDCTRVVSLRRVRFLDNLAAGLYNVLLRYRFQVVVRTWRNYHCMFCGAIYRNIPCRTLAQIRHWLELTIPDWMEGHADAHIRQFLPTGINNVRPQNSGIQEPRMRNLYISTERLTLLFPYNRVHDNRPVTLNTSSPTFFVRGLRLCLRVYPNGIGDGHGSHMSVFLALADTHILTCNDWRFPLAIRVTLVANQRRYTNMTYTIVVRNPRRWCLSQPSNINELGFEMFVPHLLLEHYFVRDGMVILMIEFDD